MTDPKTCENCPTRPTCKQTCPEVEAQLPTPGREPPMVYLYGEQLERLAPATQDCTCNPIPGGVLPPRQHLALQLLVIGLTLPTIAELMQTTEPAVRILLFRAKIKLATHFAQSTDK